MLGFPVYLDKDLTADDHNCLLGMRNAGFNEVFTPLAGLNDEAETILERLNQLASWRKNLELKAMTDVLQDDLHYLGYSLTDVEKLKTLNVTGLGISDQVLMRFVSKSSKSMWVSLDAIYLQPEDITYLKEEAANFGHVGALFDFYSQAGTGVDGSWSEKESQWLYKCNLEATAFIPGDSVKRGPFFAGETTFRPQRGIYPLATALGSEDLVCGSAITDDRLTSETIRSFTRYTREYAITLHIVDGGSSLLEENHWHNYLYLAQDIVRLYCERKLPEPEVQELSLDRPAGMISINSNGLDSDEVHTIKCNLPANKEVRVVGKVCTSEYSLPSHTKPRQKIVFKELEK